MTTFLWYRKGMERISETPVVINSENWRDFAACSDTDPDLFFPVGTSGPAIEQIENAKAVCNECEAKQPCLEFALATNQETGIWGGTSEEERRVHRRQWLAAARRSRYSG